ncbi:uracil-DNA glycosylase [Chenggangzhangella methanolivorans]|uniref:Type-5 uracil-DNA glycosylase n=1 Tax=Chenggangzhangella methanolivorans TaxID=1437009 RepID=A0A9E6UL49_9HYPH|nr:uracil-DNA glycosylase [Chenggangzhangella methanolivorans]QZO00122.1 uracil-DNA glycosylase [Chenggangzhangella methanolivorans]
MISAATAPAEPPRDCPLCPRLVAFREEQRAKHADWHNAPVPSFGPVSAKLLIVGLAPGLQGANRTGRPFTGDWAGDLLYATLLKFGFAEGVYDERPDDGLALVGARVTNAVRCVPPQNKPETREIATCRPYLTSEIEALGHGAAVVALGRIAHDSLCRTLGVALKAAPFAHGARHALGAVTLFDSYHCSRYNTNTGVLTTEMFESVFASVRAYVDAR